MLLEDFSEVDLVGKKIVAIDMEATSNDPYLAKPMLFQVATEDKSYVVDIRNTTLEPMRGMLEDPDVVKIVQNAAWEYKILKHLYNIELQTIFDTMLAELILNTGISRECSLEHLAKVYLNRSLNKYIRRLFPVSPTITEEMERYARDDVEVLFPIFMLQRERIKKEGLMDVADLEFKCVPAVAEMELAGIRLDPDALDEVLEDLRKQEIEVRSKLTELLSSGYQLTIFGTKDSLINFNSRMQVMDAFSDIGIDLPDVREKTIGYFRKRYPESEALKYYQDYKDISKLLSTFGQSLLDLINPITGRIHPDYRQIGAATARFSCTNPNLQQVPIHKTGMVFRKCFVAEKGYKMITSDYSQIELRIIAELSGDPIMVDSFQRKKDLHSVTASMMFGVPLSEVVKEQRVEAKNINFGMMYGMGSDTLAAELGIAPHKAAELHRKYYEIYSGIPSWMRKTVERSLSRGFCLTPIGRKRWLPEKDSHSVPGGYEGYYDRICRNTPIQSTGVDILKEAMCRVRGALKGYDAKMVHVVHDEILVECKEEQVEEVQRIKVEEMVKAGERFLKIVPVVVDSTISDSWS